MPPEVDAIALSVRKSASAVPSVADVSAVSIRDLSKRFPVRRAFVEDLRRGFRAEYTRSLDSVTCDVRRGEFFGLLGPNGAGKTTLFRILSTSVLPDEGVASVEGVDVVRRAREVRRVLATVPANERSLYWRLSATENLRLFGALHGLPSRELHARVSEVLSVVGLADATCKLVGAFSSGMRQRLLIARALLSRASVLLLDEPTRGLDPVSARDFRAFLRHEVARRHGCTVLLATHNADEAFELCDRVGVLIDGQLLAVGPARELSREFGGERYRMWISDPRHPSLASLEARGVVRQLQVLPGQSGRWSRVEMDISGGLDQAAKVLDYFSCAGVEIACFERIALSLADLIERIKAQAERRS